MKHLALFALPLALAATPSCDAAPAPGTLRVEITVVGPYADTRDMVLDVSVAPFRHAEARQGRRVRWHAGASEPLAVAFPCDPTRDGYNINLTGIALFAPPGSDRDLGRYGDPAQLPPGNYAFRSTGDVTGRCTAGEEVVRQLRLDVAALGAVEVAVNADLGGAADAQWALTVYGAGTASAPNWSEETWDCADGDCEDGPSFAGLCGSGEVGETLGASVALTLVELSRTPHLPAPPPKPAKPAEPAVDGTGVQISISVLNLPGGPDGLGPLAYWPLPALHRAVACEIGAFTDATLDVTLARVAREALGTRVEFAGLSCDAAWTCGDGDAPAPALVFSCTARHDPTATAPREAPVLYLRDLALHCGGQLPLALDPTVAGQVVTESIAGRAHVTWRVTPPLDPATLGAQSCALWAQGTASQPDVQRAVRGVDADGAIPAGVVYPVVTWTVPVYDGTNVTCAPSPLAAGAAVRITYTGADTAAATTFPYASR